MRTASTFLPPLFFVICLSTAFGGLAQSGFIHGTVTDKNTGEPVPGAHIMIDSLHGTTSDSDGYYFLETEAGSYGISATFIGYARFTGKIELKEGDTLQFDITLTPGILLSTAVVSASLYEQSLSDVSVSMEVMGAGYIESTGTRQLDEALDQLPGVDVIDGQANIRNGSGYSYGAGSRVMMLVDGMPMLSGDVNDVKWSFLPLENIGQVEVVKGASSVLYGSSALNGVINVRTARPGPEPSTHLEAFGGVYMEPEREEIASWWNRNPLYGGVRASHLRKAGNTDIVAGAAFYADEGYREEDYIHYGRVSMAMNHRPESNKDLSVGMRGAFQLQESSDFLIWQDADSGAWLQQEAAITPTHGIRFNIDPYLALYDRGRGRHSLQTRYYQVTNRFREDPDKENASGYYYGEYRYYREFSHGFHLTGGVAGSYSDGNSNLYGDHYGSSLAVFSQIDKRFLGKVLLNLGVRWEGYTLDGEERDSRPVLRAGINYQILKGTHLRASFGQGYRYPSMTEKYTSTSLSGVNIFPNPALRPETGWSAEAGIRQGFRLADWSGIADLAAFRTEYDDMIEFTFGLYNPDTAGVPTLEHIGFMPLNVGQARIDGFEFTLHAGGPAGKVNVQAFAGYTYTDPRDPGNDTVPGQILKYRYRHSVKADIQATYGRFSGGTSFTYRSFMERIDSAFEDIILGQQIFPGLKEYRAENSKGHVIVDLRVSWQLTAKSGISLVFRNLFNEEFMGRPGDIGPPLNFALKYSANL